MGVVINVCWFALGFHENGVAGCVIQPEFKHPQKRVGGGRVKQILDPERLFISVNKFIQLALKVHLDF